MYGIPKISMSSRLLKEYTSVCKELKKLDKSGKKPDIELSPVEYID